MPDLSCYSVPWVPASTLVLALKSPMSQEPWVLGKPGGVALVPMSSQLGKHINVKALP